LLDPTISPEVAMLVVYAITIIARGKIMTKNLLTALLLAIPALPQIGLAQTSIKDALVKHWKVTGDFTIAVAKQMPAESYGFRPVPEELSFGQLMVQVAGANLNACSNASGMARPTIPQKVMETYKDEKK